MNPQRTESHDTLPALPAAEFCSWHVRDFVTLLNPTGLCNAFTHPPRMPEEQYWVERGCHAEPLFTAEQMHAFRAEGVAQQAAEVQRLRADAERYRWLRAQREWHEMNRTQDAMWTCDMPAAEVDAAIDSARAARQDGAGEQG